MKRELVEGHGDVHGDLGRPAVVHARRWDDAVCHDGLFRFLRAREVAHKSITLFFCPGQGMNPSETRPRRTWGRMVRRPESQE